MRFTTMAAAALLLLAGTAQASSLEQPFDKTYDIRPGALISLDNTNGAVEIRAAADNRAHLHATRRVEGWGSSAKLQKAIADLRIEISQEGGGLKVVTRYPKSADSFFAWLAGDNVSYSV